MASQSHAHPHTQTPTHLLIGVDGGATEIKAHAVDCRGAPATATFSLRTEHAARVYERLDNFRPLPVAEQLAQRDAGEIRLTADEREQGQRWVTAAAEAILDVARQCGAARIQVGIGMPGLKTADGRGIHVINNGPRIPDYLAQLERRIAAGGVELVQPIAALGSDADYCGLGEEHAADGLFRGVQSAYYAGCGTGIADALKLRGRLVPFDQTKTWLLKAWQIPSALGPTFERLVSASALNRVHADLRVGSPAAFPEQGARLDEPVARTWLAAVALVLAELIFERLHTIYAGRAVAPHRGELYAKLEVEHPFRGALLDRVVIGQRLGMLYMDPVNQGTFARPLEQCLASLIAASGIADMQTAYLDGDPSTTPARLRRGLLVASRLRAAPALGAAVAAVQATA
ncbi:MAG: hypothetical protein IPM13_03390 [Phycisphaerales bacterium]|nr:hypothetical protein [Phycisphaerales bacterium]